MKKYIYMFSYVSIITNSSNQLQYNEMSTINKSFNQLQYSE